MLTGHHLGGGGGDSLGHLRVEGAEISKWANNTDSGGRQLGTP